MVSDFLAIGIVGIILSTLFEKFKATKTSFQSKVWMIGLSMVVGIIYVFLRGTNYWETILGVLAAASTTYALFLNNTISSAEVDGIKSDSVNRVHGMKNADE